MELLAGIGVGLGALAWAWWRLRTPRDPSWQLLGAKMRERESGLDWADRTLRAVFVGVCGAGLLVGALARLIAAVT